MDRKAEGARDLWRQRIAAQEASGLTVAEFCRRNAVSRVGLFAWRRRLREGAAGVGGAGAFGEVQAAPDPVAAIILELSGGVRLRLRAGFDADLLRQVVRALEPLA